MSGNVDEEEIGPSGKSLADYTSYEDFLQSFVAPWDQAFLRDIHLCRMLVELGYRGSRGGYSRQKFDAIRQRIEDRKKAAQAMQRVLLSAGRTYEEPHMKALQMREESNRTGKIVSIIYIRTHSHAGQEISGYIDYAHRLGVEDFTPIFNQQTLLKPQESDLSFYNWESTNRKGRNSPNYEILITRDGMILRNRLDGKIMYIDPRNGSVGENSTRTVVPTDIYVSMIIYDHHNRRRV